MRLLAKARDGLVLLVISGMAAAQSYPSKPQRLVIDTAPGGITDILGRLPAESLA